jgi:hypothetical protein
MHLTIAIDRKDNQSGGGLHGREQEKLPPSSNFYEILSDLPRDPITHSCLMTNW